MHFLDGRRDGSKINDLGWPWIDFKRPLCALLNYARRSERTTKMWMKIDPYYERHKCSPGILVLARYGLHEYALGFAGWGSVKWEYKIVENGDFLFCRSLYLPNFHIQGHSYYAVIYSRLLLAFQWYRNRWPWMTLNNHFALKNLSWARHLMGWRVLAFKQNYSKICRATLRIYCRDKNRL